MVLTAFKTSRRPMNGQEAACGLQVCDFPLGEGLASSRTHPGPAPLRHTPHQTQGGQLGNNLRASCDTTRMTKEPQRREFPSPATQTSMLEGSMGAKENHTGGCVHQCH